MHRNTRDSLTALSGFLFLGLAVVLALEWAWISFRSMQNAAPIEAPKTETVAVKSTPEKPDEDNGAVMSAKPEATESQDALYAHAKLGGTINQAVEQSDHAARTATNPITPPAGKTSIIPASLPVVEPEEPMATGTDTPRIAIIIDDMGLPWRNSHRAVDLPPEITLSYLPYASQIQEQVDAAKAKGHEIMLHLPMEPLNGQLNAGPHALTTRLSPDELAANLDTNLNAFKGYVGINNHMGSRMTSTPDAMKQIIAKIEHRDVYFVDSWTSPRSVAYETAAAAGLPRGRRDIFLDHEEGTQPVWSALAQAERLARRTGHAVVIGHPRDDTLAVLQQWLPAALKRGVKLVPMSTLIYDGKIANDPVLQADTARQNHVASVSRPARARVTTAATVAVPAPVAVVAEPAPQDIAPAAGRGFAHGVKKSDEPIAASIIE